MLDFLEGSLEEGLALPLVDPSVYVFGDRDPPLFLPSSLGDSHKRKILTSSGDGGPKKFILSSSGALGVRLAEQTFLDTWQEAPLVSLKQRRRRMVIRPSFDVATEGSHARLKMKNSPSGQSKEAGVAGSNLPQQHS